MARSDVLTAVAALVDNTYARTYIYPTNYAAMAKQPSLPFAVIEELPGVQDSMRYYGVWGDDYLISVYVFVARGEMAAPSTADAAAKALAQSARNTLAATFRANTTLTAAARIVRDGIEFTSIVTPLQWNQEPYYGVYFELPVREEGLS